MKQLDLYAPVETRNGYKVEIIARDQRLVGGCSIVGLILNYYTRDGVGLHHVSTWTSDGQYVAGGYSTRHLDLVNSKGLSRSPEPIAIKEYHSRSIEFEEENA